MQLLSNLEINQENFDSIIRLRKNQRRKPVLLAFLTPSFKLFDLYRLSKLEQFSKNDFFLILVVQDNNKANTSNFEHIINNCIKKNKIIYRYSEIYSQIIKEENFRKILSDYKLNELALKINDSKKSKLFNKNIVSFLDMESFLVQNYISRGLSKLADIKFDFFLTTEYKDLFFKYLNLNKNILSSKIKIKEVPYNLDFLEEISLFENKINKLNIDLKNKKKMGRVISQILKSFEYNKQFKNFQEALFFLRENIFKKNSTEEIYFDKENYLLGIYALNNVLRREILGVLNKSDKLKAETIKREINFNLPKKYTLPSIIKNLSILVEAGILKKQERFYELACKRIIMNIPIDFNNP
ncbi:MAG: hypothetical protein ABFQ65_02825 [Nanoarchaeota archaeon]